MEVKVFEDDGAIGRLSKLGIDPDVVRRSVLVGEHARDTCSAHDPITLAGTMAYGRATREFRDGMIPLGWKMVREHNLELTVSPDHGTAVVISSGCNQTGNPRSTPSTRNPKGAMTLAVVRENVVQLSLFASGRDNPAVLKSRRVVYVLLVYRDTDHVRFELSLPARIDEDGRVVGWAERILFPPEAFGEPEALPVIDDLPPIDVEVTRKQQ